VVYTIDGYRVGELVREIIRRARACRWKPHAALFKLNPVRIIIGGQLGTLAPLPPPLALPRDSPHPSLFSFCPPEPAHSAGSHLRIRERKEESEREREREREREGGGEGEEKREETVRR